MNTYTIDGNQTLFGIRSFSEAKYRISFNFLESDLTGPEELAAKFPKYCKPEISGVSGGTDSNLNLVPAYRTLNFRVSLSVNGVTGDVNEAAVKRRLKVLEIIKNLGY